MILLQRQAVNTFDAAAATGEAKSKAVASTAAKQYITSIYIYIIVYSESGVEANEYEYSNDNHDF